MKDDIYEQVVGRVRVAPLPITFEAIVDILSDGLSQQCGFDGVDYEREDYAKAKQALLDDGFEDPCLEDVQAQMLIMKLPIRLHMAEAKPDKEWYELTLDKLLNGVAMYGESEEIGGTAWEVCNHNPLGNLDFLDYDAILQFAVYGERAIG